MYSPQSQAGSWSIWGSPQGESVAINPWMVQHGYMAVQQGYILVQQGYMEVQFHLLVAVQALDQWEASIYRSRILSTNSYCSKTREGGEEGWGEGGGLKSLFSDRAKSLTFRPPTKPDRKSSASQVGPELGKAQHQFFVYNHPSCREIRGKWCSAYFKMFKP